MIHHGSEVLSTSQWTDSIKKGILFIALLFFFFFFALSPWQMIFFIYIYNSACNYSNMIVPKIMCMIALSKHAVYNGFRARVSVQARNHKNNLLFSNWWCYWMKKRFNSARFSFKNTLKLASKLRSKFRSSWLFRTRFQLLYWILKCYLGKRKA